ncbi:MAG: hypothetical protein LBR53_02110 [Deltaproteobacteria bacterium]|nr:hypothetical protein [Deltaproteobacteria bacterium]
MKPRVNYGFGFVEWLEDGEEDGVFSGSPRPSYPSTTRMGRSILMVFPDEASRFGGGSRMENS